MTASIVRAVPAAPASEAAEHFAARLRFETDCADVHADLTAARAASSSSTSARPRRSPPATFPARAAFRTPRSRGVDRAICRPTRCSSPTAGARTATGRRSAASRLAALGFSVKEMLGGVAGWRAEGYPFDARRDSDECVQSDSGEGAAPADA